MTQNINRRDFVVSGAAAGVAIALPAKSFGEAPAVITRSAAMPMVIASGNGNRFKNGGTQTAVEKAFSMITSGADVLDAVVAGVNIVELDPLDSSVGYGGLPNAEGVVQLDSCVMHGPKKRAGGVAESKAFVHRQAWRKRSRIRPTTICSSAKVRKTLLARWDSRLKQT